MNNLEVKTGPIYIGNDRGRTLESNGTFLLIDIGLQTTNKVVEGQEYRIPSSTTCMTTTYCNGKYTLKRQDFTQEPFLVFQLAPATQTEKQEWLNIK